MLQQEVIETTHHGLDERDPNRVSTSLMEVMIIDALLVPWADG